MITVKLSRDRRHLSLGELPDRLPDQLLLISQLKIHDTGTSFEYQPPPEAVFVGNSSWPVISGQS